jgi:hypothetical protein
VNTLSIYDGNRKPNAAAGMEKLVDAASTARSSGDRRGLSLLRSFADAVDPAITATLSAHTRNAHRRSANGLLANGPLANMRL